MEQLYVRKSRSSSFEKESTSPGLERRSKKFTQLHSPIDKERTRGRYACLGHRMKHKRCPLDCPERRPKSSQEVESPQKELASSPKLGATKNVLKLDEAITIVSSPKLNESTNHANTTTPKEEKQPPQQVEQFTFLAQESSWEPVGHFNLKAEPAIFDVDTKWKEFLNIKLEDTPPTLKEDPFPHHDEIDSWFLDDSPVTSSETIYSSDEFDSRRNSIGSTVDHLKENLSRILISRDLMERSLLEPYFENLIMGGYVKVSNGYHHIIRRIERIIEGFFLPYTMNRTQTAKGIEIIVNNCRQIIRLDQISNEPFNEHEFLFWMDELDKGLFHADFEEINQKAEQIRVIANRYPHFFQSLPETDVLQVDWSY